MSAWVGPPGGIERASDANSAADAAVAGMVSSAADAAVAGMVALAHIGAETLLSGDVDVSRLRERNRRKRIRRLLCWLLPVGIWLWYRLLGGESMLPFEWHYTDNQKQLTPAIILVTVVALGVVLPLLMAGKSPHVRYQASEINVGFADVVGLGVVKDEVVKTLNLFLAYRTFREVMGGNPRKAILFEGPPGTGKTYMAKAMAREAGVPFLFVSASAFQSMYYGQTNRKIRSFFKDLRRAAREEGGAIGFIEEFDAIAASRSGMRSFAPVPDDFVEHVAVEPNAVSEGITGVVNELLVQLQSFEAPTSWSKARGSWIDSLNRFLPSHRQVQKRMPDTPNVLVIGATNRASDLDPALLRPGRFDRSIHFDLPSKAGRREIIDYYLSKKSHEPELDRPERRDQLAAITFAYTPVMIEHLFDEALVWSLREGRGAMSWTDVQQAKLTEEIGLKQPVEYADHEKLTIATHEAGHAVVAYLQSGDTRKLEVLSVVKRREALGLLAHSDTEERWTRTRSELLTAIQIAFGGMTAEELFFGESGTGPSSDLAHATRIAAQMVGAFGMAGSLVSFEAVENGPITAGIVGKVLSNDDARRAVERILDQQKQEVRQLLDAHRHLVAALRDALLERDELVGDEILDVLRAATP
jgi:ATP-dependent Zn protease